MSSSWSLEAQLGTVLSILSPKYSCLVSLIASVIALDRPAIKSLAKLLELLTYEVLYYLTAVGFFGIHITLSPPFPPTLPLSIALPLPTPGEWEGPPGHWRRHAPVRLRSQLLLCIYGMFLEAPRPISGPNLDPSSATPLASVVSGRTSRAPFTCQLCPRPTCPRSPGHLLSEAPKTPSWLFL